MNINEVPHDRSDFKSRSQLRKLLYATDESGAYTTVNSVGWDVENLATKQAWEEAEAQIAKMEEALKAGRISPVAYFMHKSLMELPVLAKYMKKWKWQVKRHFKPDVFKQLSERTLQRYAAVFGISVGELKSPTVLSNR